MRVLTVNVCVSGPDGVPVVLPGGSEIPEWAEGQIGDHAYESAPEDKPANTGTRRR